jgi:hypothetical protein
VPESEIGSLIRDAAAATATGAGSGDERIGVVTLTSIMTTRTQTIHGAGRDAGSSALCD